MKNSVIVLLLAVLFVRIGMQWEEITSEEVGYLSGYKKECAYLCQIKIKVKEKIYENYPSPHAEVLTGMLVGDDDLSLVKNTKESLKRTGTIHVVVVSGYNISLVYSFVFRLLGTPYRKAPLFAAIFLSFIYMVIAGMEAPVVRSWIMGSIASIGKYGGRYTGTADILFLTCMLMLIYSPSYIQSLSFQLSFLATYGLMLYSGPIEKIAKSLIKRDSVFVSDLCTSLSAQLLVWPLLSYQFGEISLISPVANSLLLWTVPLSTVTGFFFLFSKTLLLGNLFPFSVIVRYPTYVSLDIFVRGVEWFSSIPFCSYTYKMSLSTLTAYYGVLFFLTLVYRSRVVSTSRT